MAMTASIRFEHEPRFSTVKIENVFSIRMLTAKFVAREPSASQHSPQSSLRPGRFLPQTSGGFNVLLGRNRRTPHPRPPPPGWGGGDSFAPRAFCFAARFGDCC